MPPLKNAPGGKSRWRQSKKFSVSWSKRPRFRVSSERSTPYSTTYPRSSPQVAGQVRAKRPLMAINHRLTGRKHRQRNGPNGPKRIRG